MSLRVISYGGGVQSTALVVLAAQGKLGEVDAALFANVGDDSEHPAALRWVRETVMPWANDNGIEIIELQRRWRDGRPRTLWQDLWRDSRSIDIPVRMSNGAPGNRNCTKEYKIKVVGRWLKEHGATAEDPADVMVGISTDEIGRVSNRKARDYERPLYPLIDLGMDRSAAQALNVRTFGKPAPKSACYFCPFRKPQQFAEMRRDEPDLFAKAVALEAALNKRRETLGRDPVWLTRFNKPIAQAVGVAQDTLFGGIEEGGCDDGYCWT